MQQNLSLVCLAKNYFKIFSSLDNARFIKLT